MPTISGFPTRLTLPGILGGIIVAALRRYFFDGSIITPVTFANLLCFVVYANFWLERFLATLAAAGVILLIRWVYWLVRRREGIGLGDAKLMAMLGAWLGLSGALLSFAIGVLLGAVFALALLAVPAARRESDTWLLSKLPLGTFLCIGGIISALWGQPIIATYLRWVGLS